MTNEQMTDLVTALRSVHPGDYALHFLCGDAADEIARLRAENAQMRPWFKPALCEALQRDAERYRWLRDHGTALDPDLWGDALDEAIDAAMEGK